MKPPWLSQKLALLLALWERGAMTEPMMHLCLRAILKERSKVEQLEQERQAP